MAIKQIADLPIRAVKDTSRKINFLVYGESGSGKTRLIGSSVKVPELLPMLLIDVEGGTLTLSNTYPEVESVRVTNWQDLKRVQDRLKNSEHGYKTIGVDSLTEIQKLGMEYTMRQRHASDDLAVPEIKEWNINVEQVRSFVRFLRDLEGVNCLFTALVRTDTDKRTGLSRRKPSLNGKVADEVSGFLDIVTYLGVEEVEGKSTRILQTGNSPGTIAKDRSNSLDLLMANPTMADIYYKINQKDSNDIQVEHDGQRSGIEGLRIPA